MKNLFVQTRNVKTFVNVASSLEGRDAGVPGLALLWGSRGLGKTRAALWYAAKNGAIYIRAKTKWSDSWMLSEIATEIGLSFGARPSFKALFEGTVGSLKERPKLILVDEVNIPPISCLNTLRDLHDLSDSPFLLIGHEGVLQRLKPIGPLFDRLLYISEFKPFNHEDLKDFAGQCLDVPASDDALAKVLKLTQGNVRKSIVLLKGGENRAKVGRAATIGPEHLPRE